MLGLSRHNVIDGKAGKIQPESGAKGFGQRQSKRAPDDGLCAGVDTGDGKCKGVAPPRIRLLVWLLRAEQNAQAVASNAGPLRQRGVFPVDLFTNDIEYFALHR